MSRAREMLISPLKRFVRRPLLWAFLAGMLVFPSCGRAAKSSADTPEVRTFLKRYFSTWSARDMDGYGACFDPQARIVFVAKGGEVISQGTIDFLHGQKMAVSGAAMTEDPLEMSIQGDAKVVEAAVTWVLHKADGDEHGTDFFTLRRDGDGWKIVSLVFYGE